MTPSILAALQQAAPTSASGASPFAALSLIVAPAILTNASSLLVMSTSNRLARAVDLARETAKELEQSGTTPSAMTDLRLRELASADRRSLLLVRALRSVYLAMGGFGTATLVSLVGVVASRGGSPAWLVVFETLALTAGIVGVGGILWAALLLVQETRLAVTMLQERVQLQQSRFPVGGS